MGAQTVSGPAIQAGYPYRTRLTLASPNGDAAPALFPAGCALRAQVRAKRDAPDVLAELTTANGRLVRVSDTEADIYIPAAATANMPAGGTVEVDFVRTDLAEPEHLRIWMAIPVVKPVTRPA